MVHENVWISILVFFESYSMGRNNYIKDCSSQEPFDMRVRVRAKYLEDCSGL